jgi:hypothetical protein
MPTYKSKIKIQFFETCYWSRVYKNVQGATQYRTFEQAVAAAEEYSRDRKYLCEGFYCENCEKFHVRQATGPSPNEDRWTAALLAGKLARKQARALEKRAGLPKVAK